MTKNQIYNIFYFLAIFKECDKIINTSPGYLIEKSSSFFNNIKKYFIDDIKNIKFNQKVDNKYDGLGFWFEYCKTWNIDQDEFEILNILNFILNSNITDPKSVIKNFEKYIGDINTIPDLDLSYKLHPLLLNRVNKIVGVNSRYIKLRILQNK